MHCPNPECPELLETGVRGDYMSHVSICPACGVVLVPDPGDIISARWDE
jgi:hypothetical protein